MPYLCGAAGRCLTNGPLPPPQADPEKVEQHDLNVASIRIQRAFIRSRARRGLRRARRDEMMNQREDLARPAVGSDTAQSAVSAAPDAPSATGTALDGDGGVALAGLEATKIAATMAAMQERQLAIERDVKALKDGQGAILGELRKLMAELQKQ